MPYKKCSSCSGISYIPYNKEPWECPHCGEDITKVEATAKDPTPTPTRLRFISHPAPYGHVHNKVTKEEEPFCLFCEKEKKRTS